MIRPRHRTLTSFGTIMRPDATLSMIGVMYVLTATKGSTGQVAWLPISILILVLSVSGASIQ